MQKESLILSVGSLLDSPAEAIANEVNEDLIFSDDTFSSLGANVPHETMMECLRIGQIKIGTATVTTAGDLGARYIVHLATCGFDGQSTEQTIVEAMRDGLNKCKDKQIRSLALPEIGRKTSDLPVKRIAELLFSECLRHNDREITLEKVYFRLSDQKTKELFDECLRQV